jgi:hypothetical protein
MLSKSGYVCFKKEVYIDNIRNVLRITNRLAKIVYPVLLYFHQKDVLIPLIQTTSLLMIKCHIYKDIQLCNIK